MVAAIAAPWFVLVQMRNPEFFDFFFVGEHFARFLLPGHHRPGSWYYFLPVIVAGTLPWTSLLFPASRLAWRRERASDQPVDADRFLLLWIVVIVAFFSLSSSKLPGYVLPVFPALALLAARWLAQAPPASVAAHLLLGTLVGAAMAVAGVAAVTVGADLPSLDAIAPIAPSLVVAGVATATACAVGRHQAARGHTTLAIAIVSISIVLALQALQVGAQAYSPLFSSRLLLESARAELGELDRDARFYSVRTYDQTLPWELRRPVTLVAYSDEMALGLRMEPQKHLATIDEFRERWRNGASGFAVMSPRDYEAEVAAGTPMERVARSPRLVLVRRPVVRDTQQHSE